MMMHLSRRSKGPQPSPTLLELDFPKIHRGSLNARLLRPIVPIPIGHTRRHERFWFFRDGAFGLAGSSEFVQVHHTMTFGAGELQVRNGSILMARQRWDRFRRG